MPFDISRPEPDAGEISAGARMFLAHTLRGELGARGSLVMEALGSSMEPTVPGGSIMCIEPLGDAMHIDELVAFVPFSGATMCCHRIIALEQDGRVRTKGDCRTTPDECIAHDQIVGVVRSFVLGGRTYRLSPGSPWPRPSAFRIQRQRVERLWRRLRAA